MPKRLEITPDVIHDRVKRGSHPSYKLKLSNGGVDSAAYALEDEIGIIKDIVHDNLTLAAGESETVTLSLDIPPNAKVLDTLHARIAVVNPNDKDDGGKVEIMLHVQIPESWIVMAIVAVVLIIVLILMLVRP